MSHRNPFDESACQTTELEALVDEPTPVADEVTLPPRSGRGSYTPPGHPRGVLYGRALASQRRSGDWVALVAKSWAFLVGTAGIVMFVTLWVCWPAVVDFRLTLTAWDALIIWCATAMCLVTGAFNMWMNAEAHTEERDR